ncbi:DUF4145 domain-containing protein [Halobacillus litoralis]|uniref:DUF4145 domain-containing protein n=1 Tax=Halobacillus litoralis TaxID=45668 RepID=A0A410MDP0_9BACI|nr:DUF4145 domain-containing protein [Halobacillus litoralis]QAS52820.1 hypothetical protein HLI_11740 [Halobacillus litoralis]
MEKMHFYHHTANSIHQKYSTTYNSKGITVPDVCPVCHKSVTPEIHYSLSYGQESQILFRCPNNNCNNFFIGKFIGNDLIGIGPKEYKGREFESDIEELSPLFTNIYNQALKAEADNLDQIAGLGYRKSLEFLIKDYLIKHLEKDEEKTRKKPLSQCLNQDVENDSLKDIANRASWIGNDEAHYTRKWVDKDVTDLKNLIEVTLHFILMEILTSKYKQEMPR